MNVSRVLYEHGLATSSKRVTVFDIGEVCIANRDNKGVYRIAQTRNKQTNKQ